MNPIVAKLDNGWMRARRQLRKNVAAAFRRAAGDRTAFLPTTAARAHLSSIPITRWIIHHIIYIHIFVNAIHNKFIRVFMSW